MINYERGECLSDDVDLNVRMVSEHDPVLFEEVIKSKK